ncbi:MAG: hypothetical protein IT546_08825 [Caulobacteraceae bacterium]|nr:hypothetical protein [Caulobacteraceae bacterium]
MTGPADPPPQEVSKRVVVDPADVTMPGERDAPLNRHVMAAITFSSLLVGGFLVLVALLLLINAVVGH